MSGLPGLDQPGSSLSLTVTYDDKPKDPPVKPKGEGFWVGLFSTRAGKALAGIATREVTKVNPDKLHKLRITAQAHVDTTVNELTSSLTPAIIPSIVEGLKKSSPKLAEIINKSNEENVITEAVKIIFEVAIINLAQDAKTNLPHAQVPNYKATFLDLITRAIHHLKHAYNQSGFTIGLSTHEKIVKDAESALENIQKKEVDAKKKGAQQAKDKEITAAKIAIEAAKKNRDLFIVDCLFSPLLDLMFKHDVKDQLFENNKVTKLISLWTQNSNIIALVLEQIKSPSIWVPLYHRLVDTQEEIEAQRKEGRSDPLTGLSNGIVNFLRSLLGSSPEMGKISEGEQKEGVAQLPSVGKTEWETVETTLMFKTNEGSSIVDIITCNICNAAMAFHKRLAGYNKPDDVVQRLTPAQKADLLLANRAKDPNYIVDNLLDKEEIEAEKKAVKSAEPLRKRAYLENQFDQWVKAFPVIRNIFKDFASSKDPNIVAFWSLIESKIYSIIIDSVSRMKTGGMYIDQPIDTPAKLWEILVKFYGEHKDNLRKLKAAALQRSSFDSETAEGELLKKTCDDLCTLLWKVFSLHDVLCSKLKEDKDLMWTFLSKKFPEILTDFFKKNPALLCWITPEDDVAAMNTGSAVTIYSGDALSSYSINFLMDMFKGPRSVDNVKTYILPFLINFFPSLNDDAREKLVVTVSETLKTALSKPESNLFVLFLFNHVKHILGHVMTKPMEGEQKARAAHSQLGLQEGEQKAFAASGESFITVLLTASDVIWTYFEKNRKKLQVIAQRINSNQASQQEIFQQFGPLANTLCKSLRLDSLAKLKVFDLNVKIETQLTWKLAELFILIDNTRTAGFENSTDHLKSLLHGKIKNVQLDKLLRELGELEQNAKGDKEQRKAVLRKAIEDLENDSTIDSLARAQLINQALVGPIASTIMAPTQEAIRRNALAMMTKLIEELSPKKEGETKEDSAQPGALSIAEFQKALAREIETSSPQAGVWQIAHFLVGHTLPRLFYNLLSFGVKEIVDPLSITAPLDRVHLISKMVKDHFSDIYAKVKDREIFHKAQRHYAKALEIESNIQRLKQREGNQGKIAIAEALLQTEMHQVNQVQTSLKPEFDDFAEHLLCLIDDPDNRLLSHLPFPKSLLNQIWGEKTTKGGSVHATVASLSAKLFLDMYAVDYNPYDQNLRNKNLGSGIELAYLLGVMTRDKVPDMLAEDTNLTEFFTEKVMEVTTREMKEVDSKAFREAHEHSIGALVRGNIRELGKKGIRKGTKVEGRNPGANALWDFVGQTTQNISTQAISGLADNLRILQDSGFMVGVLPSVLSDSTTYVNSANAVTSKSKKSHLHQVSNEQLQQELEGSLHPAMQQKDLFTKAELDAYERDLKNIQNPATWSQRKWAKADIQAALNARKQEHEAIKQKRMDDRRMQYLYRPLTQRLLKLCKLDSPHLMPGPQETREQVYELVCKFAPVLVKNIYEKVGSTDSLNGMIISAAKNTEEFLKRWGDATKNAETNSSQGNKTPEGEQKAEGEKKESPEKVLENELTKQWGAVLNQVKGVMPYFLRKAIELGATDRLMAIASISMLRNFDLVNDIAHKTMLATCSGMHPGDFNKQGVFEPLDRNGNKIKKSEIAFPQADEEDLKSSRENSANQAKKANSLVKEVIGFGISAVVDKKKSDNWESFTSGMRKVFHYVLGNNQVSNVIVKVLEEVFGYIVMALSFALYPIRRLAHYITKAFVSWQLRHVRENLKKPIHEDLVIKGLFTILDKAIDKLEEENKKKAAQPGPSAAEGTGVVKIENAPRPGRKSPDSPPRVGRATEGPLSPLASPAGAMPGGGDIGLGLGLGLGLGGGSSAVGASS